MNHTTYVHKYHCTYQPKEMRNPYYSDKKQETCLFSSLSALQSTRSSDIDRPTQPSEQAQYSKYKQASTNVSNNVCASSSKQDMRRYVYNESATGALQQIQKNLLVPSKKEYSYYEPLQIDADSTSSELSDDGRIHTLRSGSAGKPKEYVQSPNFNLIKQQLKARKLNPGQMIQDEQQKDSYETLEDTLLRQELEEQVRRGSYKIQTEQDEQKIQADAMLKHQIEQPLTASGQLGTSQVEKKVNTPNMQLQKDTNQEQKQPLTSPESIEKCAEQVQNKPIETPTKEQSKLPINVTQDQQKLKADLQPNISLRDPAIIKAQNTINVQQLSKQNTVQFTTQQFQQQHNDLKTSQFKPGERYRSRKQQPSTYHSQELQIKLLDNKANLQPEDMVRVSFTDVSTGFTQEKRIPYLKLLEYQKRAAGK